MKQSQRCRAKRKNGPGQCRRPAIRGSMVCRVHGGAAPQVKRKAAERLADLIDPDRVLRETAKIAYADTRAAYRDDGTLKPMSEWPAGLAAAIAGFEGVRGNIDEADGKFDPMLRVKWWDKPKALDMLMRHLALYKDQLQLGLTPDAEKLVALIQTGRDRVAKERRA